MHPRFMRPLAIAFAGGCAVLLACVVHKDSTFPNSPPPAETTPPTRTVVGSGVVTLTGGAGGTGIGGVGEATPDAGGVSDASSQVALPDAGGVGSACHPLLQDCVNKALVCYPGASGTGTCTAPTGTGGELAKCAQSSDCATGYFCGTGKTASNICLLLCDVENPGCAKSSPCVEVPGFKDNTGYCLE
jgi:hypothetical protein